MVARGIQTDCYRLGMWKVLFMFLSGLVSVLLIAGHNGVMATITKVDDSSHISMSEELEYIDIISSTDVYQEQRRQDTDSASATNGGQEDAIPSFMNIRGAHPRRDTQSCTNPGDTIDCDVYASTQCESCCWTDDNGNVGVKNDDGSEKRWCWSRRDENKERKACICGEPPYADSSSCIADDEPVEEDPAPGYCKSYLCCSQLCRCAGTQGNLDCRCF